MISRPFAALREAVSPRTFTSIALGIAALWMLLIYPFLMICAPKVLPQESAPRQRGYPIDAGQIYMAAVAARYGLWSDLYPNYREDVLLFPPRFTPRSALLTGTPENPTGEVDGFIHLYVREHGAVPPALIEKAPEMGKIFDLRVCRFISPPPLALLLTPVAFTDMRTLAFVYLPLFSSFALFGMGFFSARIYRELAGRRTYVEGVILLTIALFSFAGHTRIHQGNISPFLSLLLALAAYGWIRRWQVVVGCSMIVLIVSKTLSLYWCPLLILREIRWRTLATMAGLTVLLNGATLALGGLPAYQRFFRDIVPNLDAPGGEGIPGIVYGQFGVYPGTLYRVAIVLLCGLIYWGFWRQMGRLPRERQAPVILAALAGGMTVFCALNFTVWLSYFSTYLLFPFLGWLFWECTQARGRWRRGLIAGTVTCLFFALGWWFIRDINILLVGKKWPPFYVYGVLAPFFGIIAPAFFLLVVFRRLFGLTELPAESQLSRSPALS